MIPDRNLDLQSALTPGDLGQTINSLQVARRQKGLLLNFGERSLRYRRLINSRPLNLR